MPWERRDCVQRVTGAQLLGDIVVLGCRECAVAQVLRFWTMRGPVGFSEEAGSREGSW